MASKKYYTAEKLNEEIEKIIDKGFVPPTRLYRFQEGRTQIIVGNELRGAGFIRTYEETVKFLKRKGIDPPSLTEYRKELHRLQDDLGKLRTARGVTNENRARLNDIVKDMDELLGTKTNTKKFTTKQLYEAVKKAGTMSKEGEYRAAAFYEYLSETLNEK